MSKKILIVDDEQKIVDLLSQMLKFEGFETYSARDSYQCVKEAREIKPDLILLDIRMPAGGGFQSFNILKSSTITSTIPVIFMTAYPDEEIKKQAFEMGARGFVAKPFDSDEIVNKINDILNIGKAKKVEKNLEKTESNEISIVIIDDHQLTVTGIRYLIEKERGLKIVGESNSGIKGVQLAIEKQPNIVIMDVAMPDLDGIESTKQILEKDPNIKIIALSLHNDEKYVTGMIRAGARGYLLKDYVVDDIVNAIKAVNKGSSYFSANISNIVFNAISKTEEVTES